MRRGAFMSLECMTWRLLKQHPSHAVAVRGAVALERHPLVTTGIVLSAGYSEPATHGSHGLESSVHFMVPGCMTWRLVMLDPQICCQCQSSL